MKKINKSFCTIRVQRCKEGVRIFAKSKKMEEYFSELQAQSGTSPGSASIWPNLQCYRASTYPEVNYLRLNRWGENSLFYNDVPNLSLLRTIGIKDGVEVVLKGVFSLKSITQWIEGAKTGIQEFYRQFLKPINIEFIISTREEI